MVTSGNLEGDVSIQTTVASFSTLQTVSARFRLDDRFIGKSPDPDLQGFLLRNCLAVTGQKNDRDIRPDEISSNASTSPVIFGMVISVITDQVIRALERKSSRASMLLVR